MPEQPDRAGEPLGLRREDRVQVDQRLPTRWLDHHLRRRYRDPLEGAEDRRLGHLLHDGLVTRLHAYLTCRGSNAGRLNYPLLEEFAVLATILRPPAAVEAGIQNPLTMAAHRAEDILRVRNGSRYRFEFASPTGPSMVTRTALNALAPAPATV